MVQCNESRLVELYRKARRSLEGDEEVEREIKRARKLRPTEATSVTFLREYAWVVYNAGMSMPTIKGKWAAIEKAFFEFNMQTVVDRQAEVKARAIKVINYERKADAVIRTAVTLSTIGWDEVYAKMVNFKTSEDGLNILPSDAFVSFIISLPWMGNANRNFLPKNLGFDLAKADRIMCSLAEEYGYPGDRNGVQRFCEDISRLVKERVSVVDTVLWNARRQGKI